MHRESIVTITQLLCVTFANIILQDILAGDDFISNNYFFFPLTPHKC